MNLPLGILDTLFTRSCRIHTTILYQYISKHLIMIKPQAIYSHALFAFIISSNFLAAILNEKPVRFIKHMLRCGIGSFNFKMVISSLDFVFSKNAFGIKPIPKLFITNGNI